MKKHFLSVAAIALFAGSAMAADMPVKAPRSAPAPVTTWTGCYVGVAAGGAWGDAVSHSNGTANGVATGTLGALKSSSDMAGAVVGGTIGCNYQTGAFVLGIEGDNSLMGKEGKSNLLAPFNPAFREEVREQWLATLRGRLGYAIGPALLYATGGGAWGGVRMHEFNPLVASVTATENRTLSGWVIGGGVEWEVSQSWSAKLEYLHAEFDKKTFFANTASRCCTSQSSDIRNDVIRAGLNYRFGGLGFGG